jgi:hypothetical protein
MRKFLIAFFCLAFIFYCDVTCKDNEEKRMAKDLKLNLRGIVTSKNEEVRGKGYGIVYVDVIESNIANYDMRGKEPYFCYIKDKKAIFYVYSRWVMVGDTINLRSNSNIVYNSKGEFSFEIRGVTWEPFWDKIKESRKKNYLE